MKRTISGMIGAGSLAHNRRDFIAENVDPDRVHLNICYQNENLKEVYKELFDDSVERYNVGKRKDRQITNYYEKIRQGKQEKLFHEKRELMHHIAVALAGREAEALLLGPERVSTGASNDIEQATKLARAMLTRYGMSDDFGMVALETVTNQYLGGDASLACSADTQTKIDQQVVELVKREHDKAVNILTANREKLDRLAAFLYEKETITGEEFMHILGE